MTTARRPSLQRPTHPARVAAQAAQQAAAEPTETTKVSTHGGKKRDGGARTSRRMASGRVSYAGRAATIYFESESDRERARNAFRARGGVEGYSAETEWWADLIMEQVQAWEAEHNNGEPFKINSRRRSSTVA